MKSKIYQIDAFTDKIFSGNPAAVCILNKWISDDLMQNIAAENNLAETAFAVRSGNKYEIRWFTPALEVDLCGHATLATAYALFHHFDVDANKIEFYSPHSGVLTVEKAENNFLTLNFPADKLVETQAPSKLIDSLGKDPVKIFKGKTDYLLIYSSQKEIEEIEPDFTQLAKLDGRGIIVSAKGNEVDFVSRFFAPQSGVNEDPVTGSAHTSLTPYWSKELNKTKLTAKQLSKRGGELFCEFLGDRVKISGKAVLYMIGEIEI
jgi:PhzF family phenazine biosynthesis protein